MTDHLLRQISVLFLFQGSVLSDAPVKAVTDNLLRQISILFLFQESVLSGARLKDVTDHLLRQISVKYTYEHTLGNARTAVLRKDVDVPSPPLQITKIISEYTLVCILKHFRNTPFYIYCFPHMVEFRIFSFHV